MLSYQDILKMAARQNKILMPGALGRMVDKDEYACVRRVLVNETGLDAPIHSREAVKAVQKKFDMNVDDQGDLEDGFEEFPSSRNRSYYYLVGLRVRKEVGLPVG
jgi:hypothetical protein